MTKFLLMTILCAASVASYADITFYPYPERPVLITSDLVMPEGNVIKGPYVSFSKYEIFTDEKITLVGFQEIVSSQDGRIVGFYTNYSSPVEIEKGSATLTNNSSRHFLSNLPAQKSYVYNIEVRLLGWIGTVQNPGATLNSSFNLVTQ